MLDRSLAPAFHTNDKIDVIHAITRQLETYNGLFIDFMLSMEQDLVLILGLRSSTDFQYEQSQCRYMQELMPRINIVKIYCDKEFEHINPSGIRRFEKFNKLQNYLLD